VIEVSWKGNYHSKYAVVMESGMLSFVGIINEKFPLFFLKEGINPDATVSRQDRYAQPCAYRKAMN